MIDLKSPECTLVQMRLDINQSHSRSMIERFNKTHRKKFGVNGLGELDEKLAKKLKKKGKVSKRQSDKILSKIDGLYNLMFSAYANSKTIEMMDAKVLYTDNHEVKNVGDRWYVLFDAWIEPEVTMLVETPELSFTLEAQTEDTLVERRLNSFAKLHPCLHNKVDDEGNCLPIEEGDMVEADIVATYEGTKIDDASVVTNIRMIDGAVVPRQLYGELLGKKKSDSFVLTIIDKNDIPPAYQQVMKEDGEYKLTIQINEVYRCTEVGIDDDLAITAGYDTLEEWKKVLYDQAKRMIDVQQDRSKRVAIVEYLIANTECDDMPDAWAKHKAREVGMPDTDDSINKLKELIKHIIILKHVGGLFEIEWDDADKNIYERNEQAYADKVLNYLVGISDFKYVDPRIETNVEGDRGIEDRGQGSSNREGMDSTPVA